MTNESFAAGAVCRSMLKKMKMPCKKTEGAAPYLEKVTGVAQCFDDLAASYAGQAGETLGIYASAAGPEAPRLAYNCFKYEIAKEETKQCLIADAGQFELNENATAADAGVTTGMDGDCSTFTDDSGATVTAEHCTGQHLSGDFERADGQGEMLAADGTTQSLNGKQTSDGDLDTAAMNSGATYQDHAVFEGENNPKGKPVYYLASEPDPSLSSGCVLKGKTLNCSEAAFRQMNGVQAEVSGFPGESYSRDFGIDADSVQVSRGPTYYDANHKRMMVNAYTAPGGSGGPVSYPAGTNLGGYVTDRPVIIGAASGIDGGQQKSDTMIYVPIMGYDEPQSIQVQSIASETLSRGNALFGGAK